MTDKNACLEGFAYYPSFLDQTEHDALLREVKGLAFEHDRFRGQTLKRGHVQFGRKYVSTGRQLHPAPAFPEFLNALLAKAMSYCPHGAQFDQCIVTHYPPGSGIGPHVDANCFAEMIMAVSLAGHAHLGFRPKGATQDTYKVIVVPGSLYLPQGPARWSFQHNVHPVKTDRYSLTFRHVLAPEPEQRNAIPIADDPAPARC